MGKLMALSKANLFFFLPNFNVANFWCPLNAWIILTHPSVPMSFPAIQIMYQIKYMNLHKFSVSIVVEWVRYK